MRKTGNVVTYLNLPDDTEMEIRVYWSGFYEPAKVYGPWDDSHPADGDMEITRVEDVSDWPEGLSIKEFAQLVSEQEARLIDVCWEDFHAE